jgi:hypothetical protein
VVVCPKCGKAKGVESRKKTTTCQCGREIQLKRLKLQFLTDSPLVLADTVAKVNAALKGGEKMPSERRPRKKSTSAGISEQARAVRDPLERIRLVASELTALKGEFTIADLQKVSSTLGKDSPEKIIARLQEHNLIYEVEEGRYRSV